METTKSNLEDLVFLVSSIRHAAFLDMASFLNMASGYLFLHCLNYSQHCMRRTLCIQIIRIILFPDETDSVDVNKDLLMQNEVFKFH